MIASEKVHRICFVSDFAYPLFNTSSTVTHGGAEMDAYSIASELVKFSGFKVSFVVGDFGQKDAERYGAITIFHSYRMDFKGLQRLFYGGFIAIPKLFLALRRANAAIYIQEGASFETFLVAIFCRLTRRKFLYRVPSRVECTDEVFHLWPIMGRFFRIGLKMTSAIVTQDQSEVELLKQNLGLVSQAIYSTTSIPPKSEVIPVSQRRHILWVGRLVKMKHPEIFLKIAEHYPNTKFILNGPLAPNYSELSSYISVQASRLPNVKFYQGMKRTDLEETFRYAKLFINTSDFEGFPLTFIEAGKYGVPVITLNVDPDKVFSVSNYGECAFGDTSKLIKAVGTWLEDAKKREIAGTAFRNYVEKTNDMRNNIHAYISIFNSLNVR